ncbi:hypothetical protein BH10PSE17_BH10PSE17_25190 [soil metagenome]
MTAIYQSMLLHAVLVHRAAFKNMRRVIDQIVADMTT